MRRSGYRHPLEPPRRCRERAGRREPRRPCETFLFSLLEAPSSHEIASGRCLFRRSGEKRFFVMVITRPSSRSPLWGTAAVSWRTWRAIVAVAARRGPHLDSKRFRSGHHWERQNVGCKSSAFSLHSPDRHRSNLHIRLIYVGCSLALGLDLGTGTFALSHDDHWSARDAGRVFAHCR